MRARYYVPGVGRFASADTIVPSPDDPQSMNRYSYVNNNPLFYLDPSGHFEIEGAGNFASPQNPWIFTEEMLDINNDGTITDAEAIQIAERSNANSQRILLDSISDPINGIGTFGGCNTLRLDCPNYHPAVDAAGNLGDPVRPAAYGEVVIVDDIAGPGPNFGRFVVVKHSVYGRVYYSVYAHLDKQLVEVGDVVDSRTVIGTVGNTYGQGPSNFHLHFEIRQSANIDPSGERSSVFRSNYWIEAEIELESGWVDLGPIYGYDQDFPADWK